MEQAKEKECHLARATWRVQIPDLPPTRLKVPIKFVDRQSTPDRQRHSVRGSGCPSHAHPPIPQCVELMQRGWGLGTAEEWVQVLGWGGGLADTGMSCHLLRSSMAICMCSQCSLMPEETLVKHGDGGDEKLK